MARYITTNPTQNQGGATSITSPTQGLFTVLTGTAPYSVTVPDPNLFRLYPLTYYNATSGVITLTTPSGIFTGPSGGGAGSLSLVATSTLTIQSDGTNYVVVSWPGGPVSTGGSVTYGTDIVTTASTTNVVNTNATTINFGGAATTLNIGNASGTTYIAGNLTIQGATETINSTTVNVRDIDIRLGNVVTPTDTTANNGGILLYGATNKTFYWQNNGTGWNSSENIQINNSTLSTNQGTFNLVNVTATTVNFAQAATTLTMAATTGTTTIRNTLSTPNAAISAGAGLTAGAAITVNSGGVSVNAGGVTSASGLTVNASGMTCNSGNLNVNSGSMYISSGAQINSGLGVGTANPGSGQIYATNNIIAYYSDDRLKTRIGSIENALDKIDTLDGFYYQANDVAVSLGYTVKKEVGVSAQQVQAVLPEAVRPAPIDDKYLTVLYERLAPLFVEGIKELRAELRSVKAEVEALKNRGN
jgi:hypothetical protein